MSGGFAPVDRSILSSSLWSQGTPEQIKVWFYLLIEANPRTGIVADSDPGIALRCGLPLDVAIAALDWLTSPDPLSRTKDYEGRRIERLPDGGVRLLNHERYQNKDYSTPRVRSWRDRKRDVTVKRVSTVTGTTDKDKDTTDNGLPPPSSAPLRTAPPKGDGGSGSTKGNGNGATKGTATARELQALEADPALVDIGDAWVRAFKRPRRELGVLRAARTALAGGYAADAMKLVVRVVALAREAPERFPDRGSIRWAVEHGKAGDPGYLLRPATLDRLIPEAEVFAREAEPKPKRPEAEGRGPVFSGPRVTA